MVENGSIEPGTSPEAGNKSSIYHIEGNNISSKGIRAGVKGSQRKMKTKD